MARLKPLRSRRHLRRPSSSASPQHLGHEHFDHFLSILPLPFGDSPSPHTHSRFVPFTFSNFFPVLNSAWKTLQILLPLPIVNWWHKRRNAPPVAARHE